MVVPSLTRSVSFCVAVNWNLEHRQNVSFRTSAHTGVGISIEFQIIHRHTDCSILPFSGIHPQKIVLLSRRLPHHLRGLVRNDWFFDSLKLRCRTAAPQLFHLMQLDAYRIGSVCHSSDNSSNSNLAIGFTKQTDKVEFVVLSNSRSLRASDHTGVAISWIGVQFLVDEFRKTAQKGQSV